MTGALSKGNRWERGRPARRRRGATPRRVTQRCFGERGLSVQALCGLPAACGRAAGAPSDGLKDTQLMGSKRPTDCVAHPREHGEIGKGVVRTGTGTHPLCLASVAW